VVGQALHRRIQVAHAQYHPGEHAWLARTLGVEQGELALARVHPHQGEGVCLLDHVHAEVVAEEIGQGVALRYPEGHVVEADGTDGGFHGGRLHTHLGGSRIRPLSVTRVLSSPL
jgi:hypothetical protein